MSDRIIARHWIYEQKPEDLRSLDLRAEMKGLQEAGTGFECFVVVFYDQYDKQIAGTADLLFVPEAGRGGIAWGAPADWTDADTAAEVIERYVRGEMVE